MCVCVCVCVCVCACVCVCVCVCTAKFSWILKRDFNFFFVFVCFHIGWSTGRIKHSIYYSFDNCTGFLPTLGLCLNLNNYTWTTQDLDFEKNNNFCS